TARDRCTACAIILQRVPYDAEGPVTTDLRRLITANGLAGTPLFIVPELALPSERARLPGYAVQPISDWLTGLAADAGGRAAVVRKTLNGALDSLATRLPALADAVDRQRAGITELRAVVEHAYLAALAAFDEGMRDGLL